VRWGAVRVHEYDYGLERGGADGVMMKEEEEKERERKEVWDAVDSKDIWGPCPSAGIWGPVEHG
jgi:hypothetical protein